ncbi:MAG: branched-chain amino acid ABC transporter substrate-binding protein, partial [Chloroflexota bacterium]|nr:branched-chain amino acid ABC transporter substrate-binding protein [Chloroflexota bacterium]
MKRITTACSILMIVTMLGVTGGRTFAAHQASPARAMQSVALCSSTPYGVPALQQLSQGIRNGLILATRVWKPKFHAIGVNLAGPYNYDDARSDGVSYGTDQEHANALKCIASNLTYGYIGTLNSGAAQVSEPILNNAGMVQISPANTGPVLTAPSSRASQEPATYHHRLHYVTYYRTVTTDNLQGPTGAQFMKNGLGAHKYFLVDDKTTYGAGLAQQMDLFAHNRLGMTRVGIGHIDPTDASSIAQSSDAIADQVVSAKPDGVYCGCDSENAIALARDLRNKGYTKPLVGGDALVNSSWVKLTGNGSIDNFATSVGPD